MEINYLFEITEDNQCYSNCIMYIINQYISFFFLGNISDNQPQDNNIQVVEEPALPAPAVGMLQKVYLTFIEKKSYDKNL